MSRVRRNIRVKTRRRNTNTTSSRRRRGTTRRHHGTSTTLYNRGNLTLNFIQRLEASLPSTIYHTLTMRPLTMRTTRSRRRGTRNQTRTNRRSRHKVTRNENRNTTNRLRRLRRNKRNRRRLNYRGTRHKLPYLTVGRVRQPRRRYQGARKSLTIHRLRPTMNTRMNKKHETSMTNPILTKSTIRRLILTGNNLVNLPRKILKRKTNLLVLTMRTKVVGVTLTKTNYTINELFNPFQQRRNATTTTIILTTRNTLTTNETNTRLKFLVQRLPFMSNNVDQTISTTTRFFVAVPIMQYTTIKTSSSVILRHRQLTTTLTKTTVVF